MAKWIRVHRIKCYLFAWRTVFYSWRIVIFGSRASARSGEWTMGISHSRGFSQLARWWVWHLLLCSNVVASDIRILRARLHLKRSVYIIWLLPHGPPARFGLATDPGDREGVFATIRIHSESSYMIILSMLNIILVLAKMIS